MPHAPVPRRRPTMQRAAMPYAPSPSAMLAGVRKLGKEAGKYAARRPKPSEKEHLAALTWRETGQLLHDASRGLSAGDYLSVDSRVLELMRRGIEAEDEKALKALMDFLKRVAIPSLKRRGQYKLAQQYTDICNNPKKVWQEARQEIERQQQEQAASAQHA